MSGLETGASRERPEGFRCRITNPGRSPRVIYDGIDNRAPIYIRPGEKVEAVLSRAEIRRHQKAQNANPAEPDLRVDEIGPERLESPEPAPPPRAPAPKPQGGKS